jgi:O-antigen ligase
MGAVVAACFMWAELHLPGAAAALVPFHVQSFDVFDLPRASGPFQYPNIAAMYLEAALPVVLVAGAAFDVRRTRGSRIGTVAAVMGGAVIVQALSLTASRAGMVTALAVVAGVGLHAFWRKTGARWQAPAVLAIFALLTVANTAFGSLAGLRLKFWNDDVWYRSTITAVAKLPAAMPPDGRRTFDVDIRNGGVHPWPASGAKHVALSYHWFDVATGALLVYDGVRTGLPADVAPGATVRVHAIVKAPRQSGHFRLHLEMVQENTTWFGDQGDGGLDQAVDVGAGAAPDTPIVAITAPPPMQAPLERASRRTLWRAALMAWRDHPLLGLGPDNFRRGYNRYLGLDHPDDRLHANNLYFETLASLGIAGLGALLLVVVGLARAARTAVRQHGGASVAGLIAAGAAIGIAAYFVHGFFDYFLEFTPTYALFWLLAGIVTGLAARDSARAIE